jgi:hypothetical protein
LEHGVDLPSETYHPPLHKLDLKFVPQHEHLIPPWFRNRLEARHTSFAVKLGFGPTTGTSCYFWFLAIVMEENRRVF